MSKFHNPKIQGALRHLLSSFGPVFGVSVALVQSGTVTPGEVATALATSWEAIVGVLMAILAFWASWTAKEKA